ncbi:MAG: hypothetical protein IPL73_28470 [Candidatus Obscuribacter sp.]|nr:hypothetical protein [Candidatus Obscuribacter sp.]
MSLKRPKTRLGKFLAVAGSLCLMACQPASAIEVSESKDVSITVYNQNFGLVRDNRQVTLANGINYLRFDGIASGIDPTTVSFISLTAPDAVAVKEQNYQFDLMDLNTILSRSIGKTVKFTQTFGAGAVKEITGTLLSSPAVNVSDSNGNVSQRSQAIVVKTGSGIVVGPQGVLEIGELPQGLIAKPSLLWKLACDKAGVHNTEIRYQTQGLNGKCDYVAVANADDTSLDLTSWVTLDNKSGATYKDAALKLMAGDVHKVQPMRHQSMYLKGSMMAMGRAAAPQFSEQSFAEYHLYTLAGKTDLRDKETKQMTLFNASGVPVKKLYIYEPQAQQVYYRPTGAGGKINVKLEVANTKVNNLGMPMPKGKVRVYKKDNDGALQFIGEDLIDHTPKDEKVRVYIGDAFDLVGEQKQTNNQQLNQHQRRESWEISLRNHKESAATITYVGHAYGDWKIQNNSQEFTKKDSHTFEFAVKVPANSESKVTYDVEYRY